MIGIRLALGIVAMAAMLAACADDSPPSLQKVVYREGDGSLSTVPRIVVSNADGTGRVVLCDACEGHPTGTEQSLYPSRNGELILYNTLSDPGTGWMAVSSSGGGATPFPSGVYWSWPSWAPNSQTIAWRVPGEFNTRIGIAAPRSTTALLISPDSLFLSSFNWSPDGSRLAFAGIGAGLSRVYTLRNDGSELTAVVDLPGAAAAQPSWSPNGDSIAYTRSPGDAPNEAGVWMIPAAGGTARHVSQGGFGSPLYFSPNGREIMTFVRREDRGHLVRVVVATGEQIDVPALGAYLNNTPWSPRGDLILTFSQPSFDVPLSIFTSPPDGEQKVKINPDLMSAGQGAWLPAEN